MPWDWCHSKQDALRYPEKQLVVHRPVRRAASSENSEPSWGPLTFRPSRPLAFDPPQCCLAGNALANARGPDLAHAETKDGAKAEGANSQRHRTGRDEPPVKVQLCKIPNRHSLPSC